MKPYEWMVKCTPQTEWIERRGILFWLAFFFIELGAGAFFIASFFNIVWGMVIGWLICGLLGGGLHLLYLGRPLRFLRMFLRPQSSWISRGIIFVTVFLALGLIHIVLTFLDTRIFSLFVATNIFAFLVIIYGGFAMCCINGIPLWNTGLLPVLYVVAGIWGGAELTMGVILTSGALTKIGHSVEEITRVLLVFFAFLVVVYFIAVRYSSVTGDFSVREIVGRRWKPLFWIGVVLVGIMIPLGVVVSSYTLALERIPIALLWLSIFGGLLGDLVLRYLILKNGFYSPLIPSQAT